MVLKTVKRSLVEVRLACPDQKNKALDNTAPRVGEPGSTASGESQVL